ncbi:hypothetical protein M758_UG131200 [Ceratodon purpureus]|nr:hypothetical protein M758_UG131200 [Ceratodon purpureus]
MQILHLKTKTTTTTNTVALARRHVTHLNTSIQNRTLATYMTHLAPTLLLLLLRRSSQPRTPITSRTAPTASYALPRAPSPICHPLCLSTPNPQPTTPKLWFSQKTVNIYKVED